MRIPFNIKYRPQIESGEYRVETREGLPVRIICWDRLAKKHNDDDLNLCVLVPDDEGEAVYYYHRSGKRWVPNDGYDLFIVTPKPELSEEDERMRWNVISIVGQSKSVQAEEMIDWLKSLRPQPKVEWSEEDEKMLIGIVERGNSEIPKGECGLTPNQVAWLETRIKPLRPQPKQEWSKGDELKRDNLIGLVEEIKRQPLKRLEDWDGYINWLKSLPERFNLQPKIEWSEEDKKMLNNTLDSLKRYQLSMPNFQVELQMRWLKSIRPQPKQNMSIGFMIYLDEHRPEGKMCLSNAECNQIGTAFKNQDWDTIIRYIEKYRPHWKPSEEQMEALKEATDKHWEPDGLHPLYTLYNDLQKLL